MLKNFLRRRKYLVNRQFQYRYMALLMLQMSAILASLGLLVFSHVQRTTEIAMNLPFVEGISNAALLSDLSDNLHGFHLRSLMLLALISVILVVFGLMGSHRLAGPMIKLENFLNLLAAGDFSQRITFRRHDFLDEFADRINQTVESISVRRVRANELRQQIAETWSAGLGDVRERPVAIAEMRRLLGELRQVV